MQPAAPFEKITGLNIYDAFQADLAIPLGMQDFRRGIQSKIPKPNSIFPEYAMYLSTRDMAHPWPAYVQQRHLEMGRML